MAKKGKQPSTRAASQATQSKGKPSKASADGAAAADKRKGAGPVSQQVLERSVYQTIHDVLGDLTAWEVDFCERGDPPQTLRQRLRDLKWRWFTEPGCDIGKLEYQRLRDVYQGVRDPSADLRVDAALPENRAKPKAELLQALASVMHARCRRQPLIDWCVNADSLTQGEFIALAKLSLNQRAAAGDEALRLIVEIQNLMVRSACHLRFPAEVALMRPCFDKALVIAAKKQRGNGIGPVKFCQLFAQTLPMVLDGAMQKRLVEHFDRPAGLADDAAAVRGFMDSSRLAKHLFGGMATELTELMISAALDAQIDVVRAAAWEAPMVLPLDGGGGRGRGGGRAAWPAAAACPARRDPRQRAQPWAHGAVVRLQLPLHDRRARGRREALPDGSRQ